MTLSAIIAKYTKSNTLSANERKYAELLLVAGSTPAAALAAVRESDTPARYNYARYVLRKMLVAIDEPVPDEMKPAQVPEAGIEALVLVVKPGDWEKVLFPMDGALAVYNREIDIVRCRGMARDWRPEHAHAVALIPRPKGGYYIVDGQHRLFTASALVSGESKFLARIYRPNGPEEAKDLIVQLNKTTALRLHHMTTVTKAFSWWPEIFERYGLFPQSSGRRGRLTWPSVLQAHLQINSGGTLGGKESRHHGEAVFVTKDPLDIPKIEQTAADIAVWRPFWEPASQDRSWVLSGGALTFMLALRRQNPDHPQLDAVPTRLLKWPGLPRAVATSSPRAVIHELLRGVNYRLRDDNLFQVNGRSGREL
jgi:hypothetical protein